jgi:diadenosine tetraphosphate (Ap4A) HIT family hydrolase
MAAGNPAYAHEIIYQDDTAIAFLNKYPPLYGYVLVAPREHREQVTGDFTPVEYLALQQVIYRVAEAVRQVVKPERVYILSLGSQQGNKHVHWHIAPLPFGVPFEQQQLEALSIKDGILPLSVEEMAALAAQLREALFNHP